MPEDGNRIESSDIRKPSGDQDCSQPDIPAQPTGLLSANDTHVAVALMGASIFETFERNYDYAISSVAEQQAPPSEHQTKDFARHLRLLKSPNARKILEIVWKETGSVSEAALKSARKLKFFRPGELNSNSLARALCGTDSVDYDQANANKQLVVRVVEAAEYFNLIEKFSPSGKAIPLQATAHLDELMLSCHGTNAMEVHSLLSDSLTGNGE